MSHTRFAIYFLPPDGPLADFGARWLGWDCVAARVCRHFDVPDLDVVTKTPRKYGFHGTLKPPFRLADGKTLRDLQAAVAEMAASCVPAQSVGLDVSCLGRFLALTPVGDTSDIARVAASCVKELDAFRAPTSEAEFARRRKARLSERQDALLQRWGYPYVLEEFRFHLTLTGRLPVEDIGHWTETVKTYLPPLPTPFVVGGVALVGERKDGRFELIQRYTLAG